MNGIGAVNGVRVKAVLVDDEKPALRGLECMLGKHPEVSVEGMYTDPLEAIGEIGRLRPDVVFLDVNMSQLRGIDAASRILDVSPETDIVFVTAFDRFAVEAFEVHALDYILKPVDPARLSDTIERLIKRKSNVRRTPGRLQIRCLGRFQVAWEDRDPITWRSEKTKELFAYLLQNRGRDVSKDEILDNLWAEGEPEKAIRQLYNGVYYIRKTLEEYGVDRRLVRIDGNYNLGLGPVDLDVLHFEAFARSEYPDTREDLERLESLYLGDYLEGVYYPWADLERERLSRLYDQCLLRLSRKLIEERQWDRAENYLMKLYRRNPYGEDATMLLLSLYVETGKKSKAVRHFDEYSAVIRKELGVEPPRRLREMVESID